jgi:hypothetical protein
MKKCPTMKILISPTQSEKFDRCKHLEYMPIRLYVRKDHKGAGGFEIEGLMKNPLFDPSEAELAGEGLRASVRKLKKGVKVAGKVAGAVAPAVALVASEVGLGLGLASAATRAVLGDGEAAVAMSASDDDEPTAAAPYRKKKKEKKKAKQGGRYTLNAKKKPP